MRRSRILVCTVGVLGLSLVAACGDDDSDSIPMTGNRPTTTTEATTTTTTADPASTDTDEAASFPVTVDAANGSVELAVQPTAIVSLSPTATEMLFAIGAGEQVVAVDEASDYPAEAPVVAGLLASEPDVDAVTELEPDLVVVQGDAVSPAVDGLGVPVVLLPPATSFDESYAQIELLGLATGHPTAAAGLVETMRSDIQALADRVAGATARPTVYHEVDATPSSFGTGTLLDEVYRLAGLDNIAAGGQGLLAVSSQQVIDADPDWIFLGYGGDAELTQVATRPGWDQITAVQGSHVLVLDPALVTRWGPRTVDLLRTILDTTTPAA